MEELAFIGRENELSLLNLELAKRTASLIAIRGRRRIGKSSLVVAFAQKYRFLRFSGLSPTSDTTAETERHIFAKQLSDNLKTPLFPSEDWSDLFSFLARETKTGRVIILFDEISWVGSKDPNFLGKLKNAWDVQFSQNPKLMLILCGSVSTWIEKNI